MVVKSYLGRVTDMIHSVPVQFMPLDIYHRAQYSPVALCTVEVCLIMHKVNSSLGASLLRVFMSFPGLSLLPPKHYGEETENACLRVKALLFSILSSHRKHEVFDQSCCLWLFVLIV